MNSVSDFKSLLKSYIFIFHTIPLCHSFIYLGFICSDTLIRLHVSRHPVPGFTTMIIINHFGKICSELDTFVQSMFD